MMNIKCNIILACAAALVCLMVARFALPQIFPSNHVFYLHTLLEFLSIFTAFSIFNSAWLMRAGLKDKPSRFVLFFSLIFFAVGVVNFLHTLTYDGMPDSFSPNSRAKTVILWLIGQYLIILSFFAAFFSDRLTEKMRPAAVAITAFILTIILPVILISVFFFHYEPPINKQSLPAIIFWLEYLLVFLYLSAFACLWRRQQQFKTTVFLQLCYFLILSVFSEFSLRFYPHESDIYNLVGHLYKVLAYYFLYRAVCLSGIADYFYALSEMAQMSARLLSNTTDIQLIMQIQLEKLKDLIPQAERIVFYLQEEEFRFRLAFSWGKYDHLTPKDLVLNLKESAASFGSTISVKNALSSQMSALIAQQVPSKLAELLTSANQIMYIPLITEDTFHGFISLYIFNPLRQFTARDKEKATVFQQFAALSLGQVKHQSLIRKLSYEDSLTGLPNRRAFFEALKKAAYDADRYHIPYTIVSLDMNNLKYINDHLGHAAGDQALKLISQTLQQSIRQGDIAARLGGDEFGIIFTHMNFKEGQEKINELRKVFSYLTLPDYNQTFSLAIGGASSPEETTDINILLNLADDRMYTHKHAYSSDGLI